VSNYFTFWLEESATNVNATHQNQLIARLACSLQV
jgi:hypothetical protein